MGFLLAYLNLSMAHSKGQGKGHAHFDNEYFENRPSDTYEKLLSKFLIPSLGRTEGRMNVRMDGRKDRQTDERTGGQIDGRTYVRTDERM